MRELKVVFTKSKKKFPIFSWLIMGWTWKSFSHVALEVDMPFLENPMYWQASEGKVNYEYKTHFDRENEIVEVRTVEVSDDIYNKMMKLRLKSAGQNYGFAQNIGIVLVDILNLLGVKVDNPFKKGTNCSELLYLHVFKVLDPTLDYNPDTIKPHHILKIIDKK